ncbi:MAG: HlyD family secretion protein [Bacteroidaceae bacterium]|nr:HlyD family secretion protein [Bacteroidaceae bacterium]
MNKQTEHTEEFYDVAQRMPDRYTSYIVYGLVVFVLTIFVLGFIIEIPERVYAEAKVISTNPPITLNAQTNGKIHIIEKKSALKCYKGQYLAVIENPADYKDVLALKHWISNAKIWERGANIEELLRSTYLLGDIETDFFAFKVAFIKYHQLLEGHNDYEHTLSLINKQIDANMKSITNREELLNSYNNEREIREFYTKSDSILYDNEIITKDEFDRSNIQYLEARNKILTLEQEINLTHSSTVQNLIKRNQIIDGINNAMEEARVSLNDAFHRLVIQIKNWEKAYVFIAPDECIAEYASIISEGSFVTLGEPIYNIIYKNNSYYAVAFLSSEGSGDVSIGNPVNLDMMLYPYQEYGSLQGFVKSISMNTVDKGYLIYIDMPNGLKSDNNHMLSFAESMYGQAEIITAKKKLILLLFNKLKAITSSSKKGGNVTREKEDSQRNEVAPNIGNVKL